MRTSEDRSEIAFFDVETTFPTPAGQRCTILEFGSILVCPTTLVELYFYSTLVRPSDPSLISSLPARRNGITSDAVGSAPPFIEIADMVYDILHGRIWAGHNILGFDCARIQEAFADIGRPAPEPKDTIDTYELLSQKFGRRAGDMKMATFADYFGLGQQTHSYLCKAALSLADVRLNLEILKRCATVLLLDDHPVNQDKVYVMGLVDCQNLSDRLCKIKGNLELLQESSLPDIFTENSWGSTQVGSSSTVFLEPEEISIPSISASFVPFCRGGQKLKILYKDISYKDISLQLRCNDLRVCFGIDGKFVDNDGRPRLNFVVDAPASLSEVLESCDDVAKRLSLDSGSSSAWRPVVARNPRFSNCPRVRIHIPTVKDGDIAIYEIEIYQKESSGSVQRLAFSKCDASEIQNLFPQGTIVDAFFSLDPYDFRQYAGIRLVAEKLIIHS